MADHTEENQSLNAALEKRPPTYALLDQSKAELGRLLGKLEDYGVKSVTGGFEFEVVIPGAQLEPEEHGPLLDDVKQRTAELFGPDSPYLEKLDDLSTRELLYYDLVYLDDQVSDLVEQVPFGKFYDGVERLEFIQKAAELTGALDERERFMDRLVERTNDYGLKILVVNAHLSYSPWDVADVDLNNEDPALRTDPAHNLFYHTHPDYLTKGKAILEGMARGAYEGAALIYKDNIELFRPVRDEKIGLSMGRDKFLRFDESRLETRLEGALHQYDDPHLVSNVMLAGALNHLRQIDVKNTKQLSEAAVLEMGETNKFKVIKHLLEASEIKDDGTILYNDEYMVGRRNRMLYELGVMSWEKYESLEMNFYPIADRDSIDTIRRFFGNVKAHKTDDGYRITWPDTIDFMGDGRVGKTENVDPALKELQPSGVHTSFYLDSDYEIGYEGKPAYSQYLTRGFDRSYYGAIVEAHEAHYCVENEVMNSARKVVARNPEHAKNVHTIPPNETVLMAGARYTFNHQAIRLFAKHPDQIGADEHSPEFEADRRAILKQYKRMDKAEKLLGRKGKELVANIGRSSMVAGYFSEKATGIWGCVQSVFNGKAETDNPAFAAHDLEAGEDSDRDLPEQGL